MQIILGGSWVLVSRVTSTLSGVRSMITIHITLLMTTHAPTENTTFPLSHLWGGGGGGGQAADYCDGVVLGSLDGCCRFTV